MVDTDSSVDTGRPEDGTDGDAQLSPINDAQVVDFGLGMDSGLPVDMGIEADSGLMTDVGSVDDLGGGRDMAAVPDGCGNGQRAPTEECDDGNRENGDGCNEDCHWECGIVFTDKTKNVMMAIDWWGWL